MIIKNLNLQRDIEIIKLHKKILGYDLEITDKYIVKVFYDNDICIGYIVYYVDKNKVTISWIYGPKYGKKIMKKMETIFKKNNVKEILLNVSIDPTENKNDVMRRLNFYIGLQYKVYDIKFRKKFGPLFFMHKKL
jgi:hypothetical protein